MFFIPDVKELSNVLVTQWMSIIKDKKSATESIGMNYLIES